MSRPTQLPNESVWNWRACICFTRGDKWFWSDPVFDERGPFASFEEADADFVRHNPERALLERLARILDQREWELFDFDKSNREGFGYDVLYASMRNAKRVREAWPEEASQEGAGEPVASQSAGAALASAMWGVTLTPASPPNLQARIEALEKIDALRADEGDSITLLCDNPDGPPNNAVVCCGAWTDWQDRRFGGQTLEAAIQAAFDARAALNQGADHGR